MKLSRQLMLLAVLLLGLTLALSASEIIFVPLQLEGIDSSTAKTINELFFESLQSFGFTDIGIIPSTPPCREKTCALRLADSVNAKQVIFGSARRLGEKWIIRVYHYEQGNDKPLSTHTLDSRSIEDFEPVVKRMAEAIAKGKSTEAVASIDNITRNESDENRFIRREGFYSLGIQFGYLYPYGDDSYTHWKYSDYGDYQKRELQYQQVLYTDFVNWFELPHNLSLQWDIHIGWGAELGSHLIMLKQFGRNDYSPYVGGGTGLDYCFPGDAPDSINDNRRHSGFSLIGKCGVQLLRTYNFRIHTDAGYKVVFNDDHDQGAFVNIGIMWRKQPRSRSTTTQGTQSPVLLILAGIGGLVVFISALGILSSSLY